MGTEPTPASWPARLRKAEASQRDAIVAEAPAGWREPLRALLDGPEPDEALTRAAGLPEPVLAAPWPARLSRLLHEGSYPARLLALYPEALAGLHPEAPPADPLAALRQAVGEASLDDALGRVRSTEYLRLAARDGGADDHPSGGGDQAADEEDDPRLRFAQQLLELGATQLIRIRDFSHGGRLFDARPVQPALQVLEESGWLCCKVGRSGLCCQSS